MLGEWLREETTVRELAEFVDRVYVRHDLKDFTGDPRFVQNDYAKQTFSKLRSSIAGVYAWRFRRAALPEDVFKAHPEWPSLFKETDLAFRQAFALCPYSPEAVFRYVYWMVPFADPDNAAFGKDPRLLNVPVVTRSLQQRLDDALLIAETALKLEPENAQFRGLVENVKSQQSQPTR